MRDRTLWFFDDGVSGLRHGHALRLDPDGRVNVIGGGVTEPPVLFENGSSFRALADLPALPTQLGTLTWDNVSSDKEEADLLREKYAFSVGFGFGGLDSQTSLERATELRSSLNTAYCRYEIIGEEQFGLKPVLSQAARDDIRRLEEGPGTPLECAQQFLSKYGNYYVHTLTPGAQQTGL
jgi:hypothetical protein